jgi:hypothetical protein
MTITGFAITGVEGKITSVEALNRQRFPKLNINIEKVANVKGQVKVGFSFVAEYSELDKENASAGTIKLSGEIDIKDDKETPESIIKKWNDSKMLPTNIAEEIVNGLNFRCSATGTLIAYSLGLIPPLVISTTKIEEAPTNQKSK